MYESSGTTFDFETSFFLSFRFSVVFFVFFFFFRFSSPIWPPSGVLRQGFASHWVAIVVVAVEFDFLFDFKPIGRLERSMYRSITISPSFIFVSMSCWIHLRRSTILTSPSNDRIHFFYISKHWIKIDPALSVFFIFSLLRLLFILLFYSRRLMLKGIDLDGTDRYTETASVVRLECANHISMKRVG